MAIVNIPHLSQNTAPHFPDRYAQAFTMSAISETYFGYIDTTQDALLIFEACQRGLLPKLNRRLQEKERGIVRSGSVFVFDERESGIKRWTDGRVWSPSRILGNFLIYRELDRRGPSGRRELLSSPERSTAFPNDPETRAEREKERSLVGSLTNSYRFKRNGLIKKTLSLVVNGVSQHLISYYAIEEVKMGRLRRPSSVPELASLEISPVLLLKQNFRVPPLVDSPAGPEGAAGAGMSGAPGLDLHTYHGASGGLGGADYSLYPSMSPPAGQREHVGSARWMPAEPPSGFLPAAGGYGSASGVPDPHASPPSDLLEPPPHPTPPGSGALRSRPFDPAAYAPFPQSLSAAPRQQPFYPSQPIPIVSEAQSLSAEGGLRFVSPQQSSAFSSYVPQSYMTALPSQLGYGAASHPSTPRQPPPMQAQPRASAAPSVGGYSQPQPSPSYSTSPGTGFSPVGAGYQPHGSPLVGAAQLYSAWPEYPASSASSHPSPASVPSSRPASHYSAQPPQRQLQPSPGLSHGNPASYPSPAPPVQYDTRPAPAHLYPSHLGSQHPGQQQQQQQQPAQGEQQAQGMYAYNSGQILPMYSSSYPEGSS
ncbi:uncharacterized protein VTP21DRAFT_11718 [Calcarisporiella thermophila]|uniref:uncharacterized protein n=1 Tax=Calcarisporiella thermophila TaxID=911321 RepID=UPI0037438659